MPADSLEKSGEISHTFELLPAQRDIFLDQQLYKDVPLYNIGGYVDFRGSLDIDILIAAHRFLMRSADAFSMRVRACSRGVEQFSATPPEKLDLQDFSERENAEFTALSHIANRYQAPFSLDGTPLFRVGILRLSADRCWYYGIAHHVMLDGWGFSNWVKALADIYRQTRDTGECDLQGVSFLSLLPDEVQYFQSGRYKRDREYWEDRFSSLPQKLLMEKYPATRCGLVAASGRARRQVNQDDFARHRAYAQSRGGSVVQLYLAALYIYFSRVTDNDDIVFGVPIHNRRTQSTKRVIGTLLSVCPTRLNFPSTLTGESLFAGILQVQRQDLRHQRYPIGHLNGDLELRRSGLTRLFDISFNYQLLDYAIEVPGLATETTYLTNGFEQTPLTFTICDFGPQQDIELQLDFNHAYLNQVEADLMMSRWLSIVEQLIEKGERAIGDFDLLSENDRRILAAVNPVPTPTDEDVVSLIENRATARPNFPAVEFDERSLTYRQLMDEVDDMAARLLSLGIGTGNRVGVCLPRSADLLIVLIAAMKAGACYVPMDPEFPAKRLTLMHEIARLDLVIADDEMATHPASINSGDSGRVVSLRTLREGSASAEGVFPTRSPDDAAYILFTSGSTGVPKGVEISHRALANFLLGMRENPGFDANDRLLAVTTTSFDIAGLELYLPLVAGGTVVIANARSVRNGFLLNDLIGAKEISVMQATPATWQMMLEAGWEDSRKIRVLCGGEALPESLAGELLKRSTSLWNMYGPTETTIWSCIRRIERADYVNIGRPIRNTEVHVLDSAMRPVPVGERGVLYIGGEGLARGYFDRPDLTAERFATWRDPGGDEHRLYNTGDVVRFNDNGELEYLGRNDFQIKLRGFRIETADIEAAVVSYPTITDCLVDLRQRAASPHAEYLAAYYTAEETVDSGRLRAHLSERLPAYMIPSAFVRLERFQLTLNGKKDRAALPEPDFRNVVQQRRSAASDEMEARIVDVWREILGMEDICVEQNLFEQGVTSMDIVRAGKLLEERFGKPLTAVNLFEFPNVRALADYLNEAPPPQNQADSAREAKKENRLLARRARINDEAAIS